MLKHGANRRRHDGELAPSRVQAPAGKTCYVIKAVTCRTLLVAMGFATCEHFRRKASRHMR